MNPVEIQDTKKIAEELVKRGQLVNMVLSVLLAVILGLIIYAWWNSRDLPQIDKITLSDAQVVSPVSLCPGDTYLVRFNSHIEGMGILVRDTSVEKNDPLQTIIFSDPLRYPKRGPVDETVTLAWKVPYLVFNYQTGNMISFPSGEYTYNVSIASMQRNIVFDLVSFPFTIKDC